jgi:glycerol-3-phosphate dehydrogenase (NAD(P)+)
LSSLSVIGAGSWGTALTIVLAPRFEHVRLWAFDAGLAAEIEAKRENCAYLPGFRIPANVQATDRLDVAVGGSGCLLLVVPSAHLRRVVRALAQYLRGGETFVSATKGIETGSLLRMSQVLGQEVPGACVTVLSGPTFAREVAKGEPAAVVIASSDKALSGSVQASFSGPTFRLYTNSDPAGVEIGASLKNVIAIGAGIVQGLGLGNNTTAALVTRGLAEITRLAVACGGCEKTLSGLAGLGDLLLTCTGELSRNRRVGIELARGRSLSEILASTNMVAEGVETTSAAVELARLRGIEMPITEQMQLVLYDGKPPRVAVRDLMERSLRSE